MVDFFLVNMDFAFIICVSLTTLLLPGGFGQDSVENQSFQIKIIPEIQDQLYSLKTNRFLTCKSTVTDNNQKPILHWEVNDIKITTTLKSDRIRVENIAEDTLMLRIDNVQNGDEGTYKCVGTLDGQTDSRSVRIEVYEDIKVNSPTSQFGVFEQNGMIFCNATARPAPTFAWKFINGTNIENSDKYTIQSNQLTIKNLTFDDAKEYLCDVTVLQTGQSEPFVINYEVIKLPVVEEEPTIEPYNPKVGDEVILTCRAVGVPEPTYRFKKGDSFLPDNQVDEVKGILTIQDLKQEDEGEYTCVATNRGGSDEKSSFLDVKIPPTIRDMPDVIDAEEGEQKQIICLAEGDPNPTVTLEKEDTTVDKTDDESGTNTLDFPSVTPDDAGTYICLAKNDVGSAYKKFKLEVKYKPHFNTNFKETKFYGWEGHTANLTCLASANEMASIKWFKSSEVEPSDLPIETTGLYLLNPQQEWPQYHLSSSSLLVTVGNDDDDVYGEYQCEASNSLGTARHSVELIKAVPPEEPIVRISNLLSTMVTLEVEAPEVDGGQPVLGYHVIYFQSNDSSDAVEKYVAITQGKTLIDLRNLVAKTTYDVKVIAQNAVGRGKEFYMDFDTKEVSRPLQLNITSPRQGSEPTSYTVVWAEPDNGGAAITQFVIKYKKVTVLDEEATLWQVDSDEDKTFEEETVDNPDARSYTIHNLELGAFYDIRITAINKEGESAEEARIIKTSEGGGSQANKAADGEEESKMEDYADDNDENSINVGVVDDDKEKEEDGKAGGTLGGKSDSEKTDSANLGSGAVIGSVSGLLILIVIIAVFVFLYKRKPELVGRLRDQFGGKGGQEERGKQEDGKDPAEEEKLIKNEDTVKVENETEEGKAEQVIEEQQEEFEPDSKPVVTPTAEAGAGEKPPELATPAATTEIKITPETPEKPENPPA